MDKKRIVGMILAVLLVAVIGLKIYIDYKDNQVVATEDAKKFKSEYESLNGTKTASDKEYLRVSIDEINPVQYKTDEEIIDVLDSGTGVIYFGFNTCPWCRSMIETLLKTVDQNNIGNLYYVDAKDIRSTYEVIDKKLQITKEGTEGYYKILDALDDYLTDYKITYDGKEYSTNEKRLYAPTVVMVKDGEIVGFHEGTVDSQEDPYKGLNDEEKTELEKIYNELIAELKDSTCENKTGC